MNITEPEIFMLLAIEEAMMSLREGNCGFGAVIAKNNELIAKAHDTERTNGDSTAHAEMTVIRSASDKLGRDLSGCVLIATHEPCPMCATAVIWSGITEIAFGYSIKDAIKQGRKRIDSWASQKNRRRLCDAMKNISYFIPGIFARHSRHANYLAWTRDLYVNI